MKVKTPLLIVLVLLCNTHAWEDAYENIWIPVSPDSSFIWLQGGYTGIKTSEVYEKVKHLDSLYGLQKWPRCIFNFHIGKCDKVQELKFNDFIQRNHIRTAAIGCRNLDGSMSVTQVWKPPSVVQKKFNDTNFVFNEKEFREMFLEANSDSNHFHQTKARWDLNRKENEKWEKSEEGKAFKDSLTRISEECQKKLQGADMDCVETGISELERRWKDGNKVYK